MKRQAGEDWSVRRALPSAPHPYTLVWGWRGSSSAIMAQWSALVQILYVNNVPGTCAHCVLVEARGQC